MLGILFTLLAPLFSFAVGSSFPNPQLANTQEVQKAYNSRCYMVEPKEKLEVTKKELDIVHDQFPDQPHCYDTEHPDSMPNGLIGTYTRIRKKVSIVVPKMTDGDKSKGGCDYNNDLRWVGQKEDGKLIYWADRNYQEEDLRDFVYVLKEKENRSKVFLANEEENTDYVFDIYAKDTIVGKLPGYIVKCQETGGLVPVVEGQSGIRPPQVVPIKNIDNSLFKKNYEKTVLGQNTSFPPFKNYLIKIDKQAVPSESLVEGQIGVYTTPRVKNEMYAYDVIYHLGSFYLRDQIDGTSYVYGTTAEVPPQTVEQNTSLQLGRLWFMLVDSWTAFTPNCKPAIYLYPPKKQDIQVKLDISGKITVSDPIYNADDGWNVKASPDGVIQQSAISNQQSTKYPYLFYEAELEKGYKPTQGWLIDRNKITEQLSIILAQLGLSEKERKDFLEYWVPRLVSKPYYFAGLVPAEEINLQESLIINPVPSSVLRVRLIFEGLDYPVSVSAPKPSEIQRNGFTVIDWGGSIVGETCEGKRIS